VARDSKSGPRAYGKVSEGGFPIFLFVIPDLIRDPAYPCPSSPVFIDEKKKAGSRIKSGMTA
jgi:hypothetical protein